VQRSDRYNALMADPQTIEALLAEGARKARATARRTLDRCQRQRDEFPRPGRTTSRSRSVDPGGRITA
jgi:hypothetical protein